MENEIHEFFNTLINVEAQDIDNDWVKQFHDKKDFIFQAWITLTHYLQDENINNIQYLIIILHSITSTCQFTDIYPRLIPIFPQLINYYEPSLYTIVAILKTAYNNNPLELIPIIQKFPDESLVRLHIEGVFFNTYKQKDKNKYFASHVAKFLNIIENLSTQDIDILTENFCSYLYTNTDLVESFYANVVRQFFFQSKERPPRYKDFVCYFWYHICSNDNSIVFFEDLNNIIDNSANIDELCIIKMLCTIDYWLQYDYEKIDDYGQEFHLKLLRFYFDSYDRIRNSIGIDQEEQITLTGILKAIEFNCFNDDTFTALQNVYELGKEYYHENKLSSEAFIVLIIYLFIHYYQYGGIWNKIESFSMESLFNLFFGNCFNTIIDENNVNILQIFRDLILDTHIYFYQVPEEQIINAATVVISALQNGSNPLLLNIFHYICKSHFRGILTLVYESIENFTDAISYYEILLEAVKSVYIEETGCIKLAHTFYDILSESEYEEESVEFKLNLFNCLSILYLKCLNEDLLGCCNEYMNDCLSLFDDMSDDDFQTFVSIINALIFNDCPITDEIMKQIFQKIGTLFNQYNKHIELFKFYYFVKCNDAEKASEIFKFFARDETIDPCKSCFITSAFIGKDSNPFDQYSNFGVEKNPIIIMNFANLYSHFLKMQEKLCIDDTALILDNQIDSTSYITEWIAMLILKVGFPYLQLMNEFGNNENFSEFMGITENRCFYLDNLEETITQILSSDIHLLNYGVNIGFTVENCNHCGVIARNIINGQREINIDEIEITEDSFGYSLKVVLFAVGNNLVNQEEFLTIIGMFPFPRFNNIFIDALYFVFSNCDNEIIKNSIYIVVNRARIYCRTLLKDDFDLEKINTLFPQ